MPSIPPWDCKAQAEVGQKSPAAGTSQYLNLENMVWVILSSTRQIVNSRSRICHSTRSGCMIGPYRFLTASCRWGAAKRFRTSVSLVGLSGNGMNMFNGLARDYRRQSFSFQYGQEKECLFPGQRDYPCPEPDCASSEIRIIFSSSSPSYCSRRFTTVRKNGRWTLIQPNKMYIRI